MGDRIPQWAWQRAKDLSAAATGPILNWSADSVYASSRAFALYISEHEEAPVEPLLIEAREIVKAGLSERSHAKCNCRSEIDAGNWDNGGKVRAALTGIRRGMELERAK